MKLTSAALLAVSVGLVFFIAIVTQHTVFATISAFFVLISLVP